MNKEEIKSKISLISKKSFYIRVSDSHPLELYIGRNDDGFLTLRYNGEFKPIKIFGSQLLQIKQVRLKDINSLLFCYDDKNDDSLFISFCEDIINNTIDCDQSNGYESIINRYNKRRRLFFGANNYLSENEIRGLIGELLFLLNFSLVNYDETTAINGRSGPDPTTKDFSYFDTWYEIKTKNEHRNSITITSIEQLDSPKIGNLVVYNLEKMSSSFDGITLNSLCNLILDKLNIDYNVELFIEKLKKIGFSFNSYYDNFVYSLITKDLYKVDCDFPKLKRCNLPSGISNVKYDIYIPFIEKFKR